MVFKILDAEKWKEVFEEAQKIVAKNGKYCLQLLHYVP